MNLAEIEKRVSEIDLDQGFELIYDLLLAYGLPRASVSRVKNGSYDKSEFDQEVLWKGKVFYRHEPSIENDALLDLIDNTRTDERVERFKPRFLIIRNEDHFVARDQLTGDTLDLDLLELPGRTDFFLPWAGIEKTQVENANIADVKAAEKMAKLYDEIVRHNEISSVEDTYNLNVFFSRLLFCFFAEDTGVFEPGQFTGRIASLTRDSGEDVDEFLDRLFTVLDTKPADRDESLATLNDYGYVNGSLFTRRIPSPRFTARARALVIDCGTLDWAQINPDIFGSMIQAVVHPGERAGLGMHYTSVENIMKVIRPLFLDRFEEKFNEAEQSPRKLKRLLAEIGAVRVFDPACGSGNFLVIAYKELRKLENRILGRLADLEGETSLRAFSSISLENFYGIEVDGFAHEIAMLSLWLAKHQMNLEFEQLFGKELGLIPLTEGGQITHGNATRLDWEQACPKSDDGMTYVVGNPPYLGSSMQKPEQKADFEAWFGTKKYPRNLDYISLWFFKGAEYIADGRAELAFVSTNSVSQGDHTGLMWPLIYKHGVEISFAHQSFQWTNQAKGKAGVTCVVIGLTTRDERPRQVFNRGGRSQVDRIGPYLTPAKHDIIVFNTRRSIAGLPPMLFGSKPTDGGHLILSPAERRTLLEEEPLAAEFVKRFAGADEFLGGTNRYCLWIEDEKAEEAAKIPGIAQRLDAVRAARKSSKKAATRGMAERPWRFAEPRHRQSDSVIVPAVTSERREYIPIGLFTPNIVASNRLYSIYDAEAWVFGLIQSRVHMVWVDAVAGRLESRYSYSSGLVYNTFPVPDLTEDDKARLQEGAIGVLAARERFAGNTLAELYDPDKMPNPLREAHQVLDGIVDRIYRKRPFESNEERLELLFEMYAEMTGEEEKVA